VAKRSSNSVPFMLRFIESGPEPVEVVGHYDDRQQTWVVPLKAGGPPYQSQIPTRNVRVIPTNQSTNAGRDFTPDNYEQVESDMNND
jgi:hypothetical protein